MSATVLTVEAAKKANISIIENGRGTQAVHDVVVALRANRRSGTANTKTKAEVTASGKKPWRQKGNVRRGALRCWRRRGSIGQIRLPGCRRGSVLSSTLTVRTQSWPC